MRAERLVAYGMSAAIAGSQLMGCGSGGETSPPSHGAAEQSTATPGCDPLRTRIFAGHYAVRFIREAGQVVDPRARATAIEGAGKAFVGHRTAAPAGAAIKYESTATAYGTPTQAAAAENDMSFSTPIWLSAENAVRGVQDYVRVHYPGAPTDLYITADTSSVPAEGVPSPTPEQGYVGITVDALQGCGTPSSS